ncbi:HNH endonuclease signature motif containing protein [Frankia sp. Cas3]|uniref:HNH endonuclease signature motif containing protein n=1 Tax=Frankia sp. Cas3 TaxID=3073926 RepID=UPI002AD5408D|nr:DUF222 domain-containing protein [Frankia sp. Cas3]
MTGSMTGSGLADLPGLRGMAAGFDPSELSAQDVAEFVMELRRFTNALEALWVRSIDRLDTSRWWQLEGFLSVQAWLRSRCGVSRSAGSAVLRASRELAVLPELTAAFREGDVSFAHVRAVTSAVTPQRREAAIKSHGMFTFAARGTDPATLGRVVRYWAQASDPDGADRDRDRAHRARGLIVSSSVEGKVFLDAQFDAEGGETVTAALDAAMGGAPTVGDDRSKAQRRADALIEIARHYLGQADLSQVHGHRPQLTAVVDVATLVPPPGQPGVDWVGPAAARSQGREPTTEPGGELPAGFTARAGFAGGGLIGHAAVRRLACDARVTRLLTWGDSEILELGRATPTVSPAQYRALELRDGGCVYPGCDRPPSFCDSHHLVHWIDGGPTDLANLVLQCGRHHRRLHEDGEILHRDDTGNWRIRTATVGPS